MGPQSREAPVDECEIQAILKRIDDLEAQVEALSRKLAGVNPRENARKIRLLSRIIEGLAQTIRRITAQIDLLRGRSSA
ncbi:hypothetical protein EDC31_107116 [Acidomonas methanolica]|nr:hypothetical protein EDC31_107116 [Acidomonas methanolica]